MKKIKNKKALLFSVFASLLLNSCKTKKLDVSLFIYNSSDTFINSLQKELETSFKKNNYTYKTYDAEFSQIRQIEDINEVIENQTSKVLLVNPVDRLSSSAIIEKARKKNMPVIFFNREPIFSDMENGRKVNKNIYYVGTDPNLEGQLQAKMLEKLLGDPDNLSPSYDKNGDGIIQIVMMKGEIGHQDTERRSIAVLDQLKKDGYKCEVLKSTYCNWSRKTAYQNFQEVANNYIDDIEAVISNNDDMALGAIDYLLDNKIFKTEFKQQPFPVIGVDGTEVGISFIKKGLLYGTVKNEGSQQSKAILSLLDYLFNDKTIDDSFPYSSQDGYSFYVEGKSLTKEDFEE